ncbi:MAG: cytochrome c, partial [Pseudomonas sp.]|nr:cytochrome c [Pseudomonas sp.]
SDQERAEVLSYTRSAWGNHGNAVKAAAVAKLRNDTDPASPSPIILQMR